MQVVDDHDQGPLASQRLEQPPDGPERLLDRGIDLLQPDGLADALGHQVGLGIVVQERPQSVPGAIRVVVSMDARRRSHDLTDRPEGDVLPVGQASTAQDERVARLLLEERGDQAALADAGRAQDREELAGAVRLDALERLRQQAQLPDPPDERRIESSQMRRGIRVDTSETVPAHEGRLALELELDRLVDLDRVAHQPIGPLTEHDLARLRGLLQARGDVDGIAGHERLAGRRVAGHHLAGIDARPQADAHAVIAQHVGVDHLERLVELGRRPDGAQGIVFVDARHAEDRHHGVADELLDRPAMPLEDLPGGGEGAPQDAPHRLRIETLAHGRGARHVAEQDGHGLARLARGARGAHGQRASRSCRRSGSRRGSPHHTNRRSPSGAVYAAAQHPAVEFVTLAAQQRTIGARVADLRRWWTAP